MSSTEVSAKPLSASSSRAAFSIASTVVIRDVRPTAASSDDMGPFIPPRLDAPGRGVAPLEQDRKRLPAPDHRHRGHARAGQVDLPLGEALQDLLDHDPSLEPGEGGAQAEVDAVTEGEVLTGLADRKSTRLNSSHQCASRMP